MFILKNSLDFTENKYQTPTFLLRQKDNYAPLLKLTKNINYLQQIDLTTQKTITSLESMWSLMRQVETKIQESIQAQLVFLRENYPLKYTSYAKSCSTINALLFSDNSVEFEDAQLSVVYNEFLNGERLTLSAETLIVNLNKPLNNYIVGVNENINFINKYGNSNISSIDLVTNYRDQNYMNVVKDKIDEINVFFNEYYILNYEN